MVAVAWGFGRTILVCRLECSTTDVSYRTNSVVCEMGEQRFSCAGWMRISVSGDCSSCSLSKVVLSIQVNKNPPNFQKEAYRDCIKR